MSARIVRGDDIATAQVSKVELNRVVREFAIEISSALQRKTGSTQ
mgnify:FL=1